MGARPSDGSSSRHDFRGRHQGAPDRHHLLLAAAHGAHGLLQPLPQSREEIKDHVERRGLAAPRAGRKGAQQKVLAHGQLAENAATFGNQREAGLDDVMDGNACKLAAVHRDACAAGSRNQAARSP